MRTGCQVWRLSASTWSMPAGVIRLRPTTSRAITAVVGQHAHVVADLVLVDFPDLRGPLDHVNVLQSLELQIAVERRIVGQVEEPLARRALRLAGDVYEFAYFRQRLDGHGHPVAVRMDDVGGVDHDRDMATPEHEVAAPQFIPRAAFPDDFSLDLPEREVYGRGGAVIVEPAWGEIVAGPLYGEEGMLVHDCDLRDGLHAKRWFDAVGHYSREDVLGAALGAAFVDDLVSTWHG